MIVGGYSIAALAESAPAIPGLIISTPPDETPATIPAATPSPTSTVRAPQRTPARAVRKRKSKNASRRSGPKRTTRSRKKKSASLKRRTARKRQAGTAIAALINDVPITRYEVVQRARLMSTRTNLSSRVRANFQSLIKRKSTNTRVRAILRATIDENKGKSREQILAIFERRKKAFGQLLQKQAISSARASVQLGFHKKALNKLIEERLKLQEAKRLKIVATDKQLNRAIASIARRNKTSVKAFKKNIGRMGIDFSTMRERIRTQLSWNNVIQAKFSRIVSINQRDIDQQLAGLTTTKSTARLRLHRITLSLPEKFGQASMAKRLSTADTLRRRFLGCASTAKLAKSVPGAKYKDLGMRLPATVPEPTRSLLLGARDGEMIPPTATRKGIELYAVCGREAAKRSMAARDKARAVIRRKKYNILAQRHLMDLKRDAHIEYR